MMSKINQEEDIVVLRLFRFNWSLFFNPIKNTLNNCFLNLLMIIQQISDEKDTNFLEIDL